MSLPRYKFAKEVEPDLLQFLKVAREQKSDSSRCDLEAYEVWKKILPPDPELIEKLEKLETIAEPVIDLCSEEETENVPVKTSEEEIVEVPISSVGDMVCVIKENIETQNVLSDVTKQYLSQCEHTDLEMLFGMLEENFTSEEVYCLGTSLQSVVSDVVVPLFCHNILMPRLKKEFHDKLLTLLHEFTIKCLSILTEECCSTLKGISSEEANVFLQYMKKLDLRFQSTLLRSFIVSTDKLDESSLLIVEALINKDSEYEALSKLVHMLSTIAEDHTRDKNFGKLLMSVIEALGPNLLHLEQPLKHIISGHKSVWKAKLDKTFSTCYEDSMMFTQSFRE